MIDARKVTWDHTNKMGVIKVSVLGPTNMVPMGNDEMGLVLTSPETGKSTNWISEGFMKLEPKEPMPNICGVWKFHGGEGVEGWTLVVLKDTPMSTVAT